MLREAGELVKREGWQNVELVQADAAKMHFDEQFDVVMCTMGLAVIPGYQEAVQRGWEHVKPGGVYAIGDICESERWYTRPIGFLNDFLDIFIVADTSRRPWEWMEANGEDYRREEVFHGYFYAATVRKPKEAILSV
jgi:ubiquinone/menaquinone biosynthesis C-methylase UbiE